VSTKERFESAGWDIQFRKNDVIAVSPDQERFTVCSKFLDGGDYEPQLQEAYKVLIPAEEEGV